MALIACAECGNQVSDKAPSCPKCGCPTAPQAAPPAPAERPVAEQLGRLVGSLSRSPTAGTPKRVSPAFLIALVVLMALGVGGYAFMAAQEQAAVLAKRRIEEDRQREEAELRQRATSDPGSVLTADDFKFYDKGIINSYRQLTSVSIANRSKFSLRKLSGQVEWLGEDGSFVGASPFTLSGSIAPGDTKVFSTTAGTLETGTIQGSASKVRLKFAAAQVLE